MSTTSVSFSELETAAQQAQPVIAPATTAVTEATQTQPQFSEQDAATLKTFADAGINLTTYQQLLQANQIVQKLPELLKTNPRLVTAEIAKADPEAYRNLLSAVSDEWYEVIGQYEAQQQQQTNGTASSTPASAKDPRIDRMQATLDSMIAQQNQEKTQRQQATALSNYNNQMDKMLAKLPEGIPETAKKFVRLEVADRIRQDPAVLARVSNGVYVDLPKFFADASALATADFKAAATKEQDSRAGVESRGIRDIVPAAQNTNGTQAGPGEDPIWGDTGLAQDTQKALKAR